MAQTRAGRLPLLVIGRSRKRGFRLSDKSFRPQDEVERGSEDSKGGARPHAAGSKLDKYFNEDQVARHLKP